MKKLTKENVDFIFIFLAGVQFGVILVFVIMEFFN